MEYLDLLQEFVMGILLIALPPLAVCVGKALVALANKWLADVEAAKPELVGYLRLAVEMAVSAAEQMELAGFVQDKKRYALGVAQSFLNEHGWDEVDIAVLEAAIEAEVLKQFPQ